MADEVRVRIAPSPTGEDLHIGNLYTALINWAFAKKHNGKFVIRIEDTDRARFVKGSEERILKSLHSFGLDPDESPEIGGPFAPYRQSERITYYIKYAHELIDKDLAYYCFCSRERLAELKEEAQKADNKTKHREFCEIGKHEVEKNLSEGKSHVIRLKTPVNEDITFHDLIRGNITINSNEIDDQVLIKSDGYPTYHMAVVVDDYMMKISHVIRAEEWISSTPKHILLYKAFGWEVPVLVHLPILRNSDKSKLSKRKNPVWVFWYLKEGYLPEAILNYLALMGWSHPKQKEIFSMEDFIQNLELKDISAVGPAFDPVKLEWMNGEYIRALSDGELAHRLQEYLADHPTKRDLAPLVPLVKERIKKLSDFVPLTHFLFSEPEYDEAQFQKLKAKNQKEMLERILKVLRGLGLNWEAGEFERKMRGLAEELQIPVGDFFQLVRMAFSGQAVTPPLFECMKYLGEEKTIQRLEKAIEFLGKSEK